MIREAKENDLQQILNLYLHLHEESVPEHHDELMQNWELSKDGKPLNRINPLV